MIISPTRTLETGGWTVEPQHIAHHTAVAYQLDPDGDWVMTPPIAPKDPLILGYPSLPNPTNRLVLRIGARLALHSAFQLAVSIYDDSNLIVQTVYTIDHTEYRLYELPFSGALADPRVHLTLTGITPADSQEIGDALLVSMCVIASGGEGEEPVPIRITRMVSIAGYRYPCYELIVDTNIPAPIVIPDGWRIISLSPNLLYVNGVVYPDMPSPSNNTRHFRLVLSEYNLL